ncbi:MAG: hypothetical protein SF069_00530 [Phycisphaerae bacterium]|nr:hypothetical protein [Phycisphaerae bacterium]
MSETPDNAAPDYTTAKAIRLILDRSPSEFKHRLAEADMESLGLLWVSWLDKADALSDFAGNAAAWELIVRLTAVLLFGTAFSLVEGGLWWLGAAIIPAVLIFSWWLWRRSRWLRSVRMHIVWGNELAGAISKQVACAPSETGRIALEKVSGNVAKFEANYAEWTGSWRRVSQHSSEASMRARYLVELAKINAVGMYSSVGEVYPSFRLLPFSDWDRTLTTAGLYCATVELHLASLSNTDKTKYSTELSIAITGWNENATEWMRECSSTVEAILNNNGPTAMMALSGQHALGFWICSSLYNRQPDNKNELQHCMLAAAMCIKCFRNCWTVPLPR